MSRKAHATRRPAPARPWLGLLAVLLVSVHAGMLDNPFVYDDVHVVVRNPSLRPPQSWRGVLGHALFRPVVNMSYALDYRIGELGPRTYHLQSLAWHAA